MAEVVPTVVLLLLTGLAGWALVDTVLQIGRAAASRRWPVVRGRVVEARADRWPGQRGGPDLRPVVKVSYRVDGSDYETNRIAFWGIGEALTFLLPRQAEGLYGRWRVGEETDVRHHPSKPAVAVLVPGLNGRLCFSLVSDVALLALMAASTWLFLGAGR